MLCTYMYVWQATYSKQIIPQFGHIRLAIGTRSEENDLLCIVGNLSCAVCNDGTSEQSQSDG